MHFECADQANNVGKGVEVTVKSERKTLSLTLTFNKETFYPLENFEPRVKVSDAEGTMITDAVVNGVLAHSAGANPISFFYSSLCDCYKAYLWLGESYVPGQYTLSVNANGTYYKTGSAEKSFLLVKPSLKMTLDTDKSECNPGDSTRISARVTDAEGNSINNAQVSGDIRDAATGGLISSIYPSYKDGAYVYDYYVGPESLGKSLRIYAESVWKEQRANATAIVAVTKRGLNGDVTFEKDVLAPGDTLRGKIKVFDKNGVTVADAYVVVEMSSLASTSGTSTSDTGAKPITIMPVRTLYTTYRDGFYYIDDFRIDEWMAKGKYEIKIKISRKDEAIEILKKQIQLAKYNKQYEAVSQLQKYLEDLEYKNSILR